MTINHCQQLLNNIIQTNNYSEKTDTLDKTKDVQNFLHNTKNIGTILPHLSTEETYVFKAVIAIKQSHNIFNIKDFSEHNLTKLKKLLANLVEIDRLYHSIGGIIGYHTTVLQLLEATEGVNNSIHYHQPQVVDITTQTPPTSHAIRVGIESLPLFAEMYPIGGAGDRLNLIDSQSGEALPAALLPFCGRSLLAGIIRDVQAKEYLYYRLFGTQLMTPIALMTSHEKNNHQRITDICEQEDWFGRPNENIRLFTQPLVPVLSNEGNWIMRDVLKLSTKPGGHGLIWKLADDKGILNWFEYLGRKKLLIRQINNPIAGTDYGILATKGIGVQGGKTFGVASCQRYVNTTEGMNVLHERKVPGGYEYGIRNIEYTEFKNKGVDDTPINKDSTLSVFPTNTNILYVDIAAAKEAMEKCSIPGMIINMKSQFVPLIANGTTQNSYGGRLESTMQSIANVMTNFSASQLSPTASRKLNTFLTYNLRRKTIAVTKNCYQPGVNFYGTPIGTYYEMLQNYHELLVTKCGVEVPNMPNEEEFVNQGPSFISEFHPALGPCWDIIAQKVREGKLKQGSEFRLEIAEVDIQNLEVDGSFVVEALDPLGKKDSDGLIEYSTDCGKCTLKNVRVHNKGIDRSKANEYWSGKVDRKEMFKIKIHGNGEFFAENVSFSGDLFIEVPDGVKVTAYMDGDKLRLAEEGLIDGVPSWEWKYAFDANDHIQLIKNLECSRLD